MSHCITIVSVLVCLAIILLITFYHCFTGWNIFWLQKKGTKLKPPKHKRKFIGSNTKFSTWVRPGFRESNNFLLISVFTLLLAAYIFSHRIRLPPCSQRRWPYATTTYLEYIAMFILEYIACDGKVSFFFHFSEKILLRGLWSVHLGSHAYPTGAKRMEDFTAHVWIMCLLLRQVDTVSPTRSTGNGIQMIPKWMAYWQNCLLVN